MNQSSDKSVTSTPSMLSKEDYTILTSTGWFYRRGDEVGFSNFACIYPNILTVRFEESRPSYEEERKMSNRVFNN